MVCGHCKRVYALLLQSMPEFLLSPQDLKTEAKLRTLLTEALQGAVVLAFRLHEQSIPKQKPPHLLVKQNFEELRKSLLYYLFSFYFVLFLSNCSSSYVSLVCSFFRSDLQQRWMENG